MGRILCTSHGASGVVLVSNDVAAAIRCGELCMNIVRYDIDWLGDRRASISYFVSSAYAEQFGLPEPADTLFDLGFEARNAEAVDALTAVCAICFNEYLGRWHR